MAPWDSPWAVALHLLRRSPQLMWSVWGVGWLDPALQSRTSPKGLPALELPGVGWGMGPVPLLSCPLYALFLYANHTKPTGIKFEAGKNYVGWDGRLNPHVLSPLCAPFSCPQSFPASGSLPMSQLFTLGGQRIYVKPSACISVKQQWNSKMEVLKKIPFHFSLLPLWLEETSSRWYRSRSHIISTAELFLMAH